MFQGLTGVHFLIIFLIILLLFGAPKLPGLAKSIGQSMRILKKEVGSDGDKAEGGAAQGEQAGTYSPAHPAQSSDASQASAPQASNAAQNASPRAASEHQDKSDAS